jgi:hypothetical protein
MLKIKGNKEFSQWWDHWMSRIHSNSVSIRENHTAATRNSDGRRADSRTPVNPRHVRLPRQREGPAPDNR